MSILCSSCDGEIFEDDSKFSKYKDDYIKSIDRCLYIEYTIDNANLNNFETIISEYISYHKKKFIRYLFKLSCEIELNNNFIKNFETNYQSNSEWNNIKSLLIIFIDNLTSQGYEFCKINHMTFITMNDKCFITFKHYINQPILKLERRMNLIIVKNPSLIKSLDKTYRHCLITKYT